MEIRRWETLQHERAGVFCKGCAGKFVDSAFCKRIGWLARIFPKELLA